MPRFTNCSFCNLTCHTIRDCRSDEGTLFLNDVTTKSIDYLVMGNRETCLFTKSMAFYNHLNCYNMKYLRFILSKKGESLTGTKKMLASRYVYRYFISELALQQFPDILSYDDILHCSEYLNYWRNISLGFSVEEADAQINEYFQFVLFSGTAYDLQSDFNYESISTASKFQIDVTIEKENDVNDFECAICMQDDCSVSDKIRIQCNHSFCKDCITQYMIKCQESNKFPTCALCRGDFTDIKVNNIDVLEVFQDRFCVEIQI